MLVTRSSEKTMNSLNPCCALWKTKYSKMEEKRNALRQGVEILKGQIDRLLEENANLKKASDEDRARLKVLEEEKGKETSLRMSMETEISALKLNVSSIEHEVGSGNADLEKEATHLRRCLSDKEVEMDRLRQLLAEEITRADAEGKAAELERKNVAELQKSLECEKSKVDEAIKMADSASRKAEEYRVQLETVKDGAERTNLKWEELFSNLEAENQKAIEVNRCSDEKSFKEEVCYANDTLVKQLEEEKKKVEKLQKEMHELMLTKKSAESSELDELKRKFEAEEKKVAEEKRHVEEEKAKVIDLKRILDANKKSFSEEKRRADELLMLLEEEKQQVAKLQIEIQEALSSQKTDFSELEELKRNLEEERKKVAHEQIRVKVENTNVMEQRRIVEVYKQSSFDEKCRADNLSMQLEEEKKKFKKLQRELEVAQSQKTAFSSELNEVRRNLELEKKKFARERKHADLELSRKEEQIIHAQSSFKNAMDEKYRADKLFEELQGSKKMIQNLEAALNKLNGMLEAARKEVAKEKLCADMQKSKAEEQGKVAIENEKRVMEEKCRGDNLFQELEICRQKLQRMEYELQVAKTSNMPPVTALNEQTARVNLLQEQLKLQKQRVKHFKDDAKLQKGRNSILQQELRSFKHEFHCLLDHLGMLSDIFGARKGGTYTPKIPGPSQMHFRGEDELRFSCLSSKHPSCLFKSNMGLMQAVHCMESTSGMENDLNPLQGGSHGDILSSSAVNSDTASFSDEQLVGSQERVTGSLTMSAGLSVHSKNQHVNSRATLLRCFNECCKSKNGDRVGIVREQSPLETSTGHAKKRKKILVELESIKDMHLEGKRIFQEAERKLFAVHDTLLQPKRNKQVENKQLSLPASKSNLYANPRRSSKKRKNLREPEVVLQQAGESNVQMEVAPSVTERREEGSQPLQILGRDQVTHNQDDVMRFEEVMNGDCMKLLDLDDAVAEESFKTAMERPLSPNLPEFDFLKFGQKVGAQTLFVPTQNLDDVTQHGFSAQNKNQLCFVLFSDMEDIGSITRIFCAARTCVYRCCLFLKTVWSMHDILGVLLLEKELSPRERACVLFSLMLLNVSAISSNKSANFHIGEEMVSLSAHIHTVLFNSDTRELCAKICDLRDLITLSEDFVLNRKLLSNSDVSYKFLDGCGSSIEILDQGEKVVLWPKMAPTDLVVAGSSVLASLCKAVGHIGFLWEVSLKILQMGRVEYPMALSILHSFAYVCGKEYFTISNYSSVMKVVKSVVTFMEGCLTKNTKDLQLRDNNQFATCVRCPFSEGSVTLDDVSSELLEELQKHMVSQIPAASVHSSNWETLSCCLGDVLSSLELIASIMCWDWVCDKILPKLFQMLELSHQDKVLSTALVALTGYIGRLGVEARGYNDTGVEGIKHRLLGLLCQTAASKCDSALPMAVVYGLIGLFPRGHEMFQKGYCVELPSEGHLASASSESDNIVSKFLSSLSSGQITSLASLVNADIRSICVVPVP